MELQSVIVPTALAAIVTAPIVVALAWRRSRNRLSAALLAGVVLVAAGWFVVVGLVSSDYHDADGWVDCWPHCSRWQETVRLVLPTAPLVALALALGALLAAHRVSRAAR